MTRRNLFTSVFSALAINQISIPKLEIPVITIPKQFTIYAPQILPEWKFDTIKVNE